MKKVFSSVRMSDESFIDIGTDDDKMLIRQGKDKKVLNTYDLRKFQGDGFNVADAIVDHLHQLREYRMQNIESITSHTMFEKALNVLGYDVDVQHTINDLKISDVVSLVDLHTRVTYKVKLFKVSEKLNDDGSDTVAGRKIEVVDGYDDVYHAIVDSVHIFEDGEIVIIGKVWVVIGGRNVREKALL